MADSHLQGNDGATWILGPGGYFVGDSRDRRYILWRVDGPELHEAVEVVPLSVTENLATALEHIAETWKWGNGAGPYAAKALAAYRAAHPREETTG